MDEVDIGMIGAGGHANSVHYPSLVEIPDAKIVAICDLNEERLKNTADKYGVKERFTDYKRMLDEIDLDAVYIIMDPVLLDPLVMECLKRKKHVLTEKPPGVSPEETKKWADEAKANHCLTMVAFNRRFVPIAMEAKEILQRSGPITQCLVTFHKYVAPQHRIQWERYHESYRQRAGERAIAPYMDDVCHAVDLLRWAGGEVQEVFSYVTRQHSDAPNTYHALVVFENGAIGVLNTNYASGTRVHSIELQSKYTWAFVDLDREPERSITTICSNGRARQVITSKELCQPKGPSADSWRSPFRFYGYMDENRHFVECIKEKRQPQTSFEDSAKTMDLILKIQSGKETPSVT